MPQFTQKNSDINLLKALANAEVEALKDPARWIYIAKNDTHVWGEIQGSNPQRYYTQLNRTTGAIACSCPSQKHPCKHGLALTLLFGQAPAVFTPSDTHPEWVKDKVSEPSSLRANATYFFSILDAGISLLEFFV